MKEQYMNDKIATRIVFFIMGLITATWAVIVPFAKTNTGINEGVLGTLLLCLGIGALLSMPLAGPVTSRFGCQKTMLYSNLIMLAAAPFLSFVSNVYLLAAFLLTFGIGVGMTDCAMNVQAILVEKKANRALMSGFHGMYSMGGIAGAGLMTGLLSLKLNIVTSTLMVLALIILLFAACYKSLLPYANSSDGPPFAIPKGIVLILGVVCCIVFLVEGTVLDWSAVYLTDAKHMDHSLGGLGFAIFATAMTIGRLTGDRIIERFGSTRVVVIGSVTTLIGFYFVVKGLHLYTLLSGYFLIGAGCSNIVPVMFNQIGRQNTMPQKVAVPAVTTLGYLGILAGPAGIGFIAHQSSLSHALVFVAGLMVVVLILTIALKKGIANQSPTPE